MEIFEKKRKIKEAGEKGRWDPDSQAHALNQWSFSTFTEKESSFTAHHTTIHHHEFKSAILTLNPKA